MAAALAFPQAVLLSSLTRLYHRLAAVSEEIHGAHGITTGTRSILLLLSESGSLTLSEIARERGVSRQFIQRITAPLIAGGLVMPMPNPRNKRSPKLVLTESGQEAVGEIIGREAPLSLHISHAVSSSDMETARHVLEAIDNCIVSLFHVQ